MDQSGWIPVEHLLGLPGFMRLGASVEDVETIFNSDQLVKRFLLERRSGQLCINVRQGWSTSSGVVLELALETVTAEQLPEFLFHGSYLEREDSLIGIGAELAAKGFGDRSQVHWSLSKSGGLDASYPFRHLRFKRGTTTVVVVRPRVLQAQGVGMFKSDQRSYQGGAVLTRSIKPNLIERILHYRPTDKLACEETRRRFAESEDSTSYSLVKISKTDIRFTRCLRFEIQPTICSGFNCQFPKQCLSDFAHFSVIVMVFLQNFKLRVLELGLKDSSHAN